MMIRFIFLLILVGCYRVPDRIDPRVCYPLQDQHFQCLEGAFSPLSSEEKLTDWGKEMVIGKAFVAQLDLYRAISTYKRAEILVPADSSRIQEIEYDILLCYFLARKYDEVIDTFERSTLAHVDKSFPAYHDLLLILYECYREMDVQDKQEIILELIRQTYPVTGEKLQVSCAIREGDIPQVECFAEDFHHPAYLDNLLDCYYTQKKSVAKAQFLNAILPGAGYLYIGQRTSALTAFFLNGLFIAAATEFFLHRHLAAGIITTSFEAGWYFGGIYGAGLEAKYYNERLYEKNAAVSLNEHKLFPVLMLEHNF